MKNRMDVMETRKYIADGKAVLGIELGSTRIKGVLLDGHGNTLATGGHGWENKLVDGIWTYDMEDVHVGLQSCFAELAADVRTKYDVVLTNLSAIGISGMMHGYLVFGDDGELLVPFRTWRNTMTGEAAEKLTETLGFNIPQRWSIAHLYQAMLNGEEHLSRLDRLTTLSGYVHSKLTGENVIGVGEASGMFPVDSDTMTYHQDMVKTFNDLADKHVKGFELTKILPSVLVAGERAGTLTEEGAKFLDPSGNLMPGIPLCPPEGDAGTGMIATNSVRKRTGNLSAGTSIFAMIVLENNLSKVYPEIDIISTPAGAQVGMVHGNNCTSDLNAWASLFKEFMEVSGNEMTMDDVYGLLYKKALEGDLSKGDMVAYNYYSGEHITGFEEGRPLFVRKPDSVLNLANFMKTHLNASIAAIHIGMELMTEKESVEVDCILGHGGLFKTKGVGQNIVASALNIPVAVLTTAGEGGAWGIAALAAYSIEARQSELSLEDYLDQVLFESVEKITVDPDEKQVAEYKSFMDAYMSGLVIEKAAVDSL